MTTQPLVINGATIAGVEVLACVWDEDPPSERTHSGAAQSMEFIGFTYELAPCTRAVWSTLNTAITALGGKITSLKAISQDYGDPDTYVTINQFDSRGMWPQRPKGFLRHHLIMGAGKDGGPTLRIDHVTPARV
jgi:hypothetical protein